MLVLGRNLNETIVIDGKIFIKIVRGKLGNGLKLAIEAPKDVSIVRGGAVPRHRGDGGKVGQGFGARQRLISRCSPHWRAMWGMAGNICTYLAQWTARGERMSPR